MSEYEATELADFLIQACHRRATVRKIGNGEHVVILQKDYYLWSAEDWRQFRQAEENEMRAARAACSSCPGSLQG